MNAIKIWVKYRGKQVIPWIPSPERVLGDLLSKRMEEYALGFNSGNLAKLLEYPLIIPRGLLLKLNPKLFF